MNPKEESRLAEEKEHESPDFELQNEVNDYVIDISTDALTSEQVHNLNCICICTIVNQSLTS